MQNVHPPQDEKKQESTFLTTSFLLIPYSADFKHKRSKFKSLYIIENSSLSYFWNLFPIDSYSLKIHIAHLAMNAPVFCFIMEK